jgi:hypothetical protein
MLPEQGSQSKYLKTESKMGVFAGPNNVDDGLLLSLDAANIKGYDKYENLLTNSVRTADWIGATSGTGWTITANNSTAPDGTNTATLLTQTSSLTNSAILWINGGNTTGQVMSIFCKSVSGSAVIQGQTGNGDAWTANLSTNVFTDASGSGRHPGGKVEDYSNSWKRVSIPMLNVGVGGSNEVGGDFYLTISGTGSVLLWGWQRERGSTANDYYPTTGTAKTRGTTLKDLSGRGNNGTLTGGPTYSNGSIVFDGVDDYISTGLSLPSPSTTPTTFDLVFKYNSSNSFRGLIGASNYQVSGFSVGFMGQSQMRNTYNASGLQFETNFNYDSSVISQGTFVFNGRNITIYRNSLLVTTLTASFDVVANGNGISIGTNGQGGWGVSQSDIYAVRVYNRELKASEIQQNFNALRGKFGL